jgi:hypothetical protein
MMKTFLKTGLLAVTVACLISCSGSEPQDAKGLYSEIDQKAAPNTLTDKEKKSGWQLLFNGSSTSGWRGYNMTVFPDAWAIEDECLTMNTQGGAESQDIITEKTYKDFALSVDYKVTPGANSGIIYQIKEDTAYKFPYETGPEMQIIDDDGWPGGLEDWQKSGASYAMYPAKVRAGKPVGEWNNLFIYVKDNMVTQILNSQVVVEFEKYSDEWNKLRNSGKWTDFPDWGKFDEGHISLQNHGTKVWFRNVKIKEL